MIRRRVAIPFTIAALCLLAAPAAESAEVAVSLDGGWRDLTSAPKTADALFEARGGPTFGASLRAGFGSFYVAGSGRFFQADGERVAIGPNGEVFGLGHPLTLRMIPVIGTFGYRFNSGGTLVPYAGLGAGVTMIEEESEIAGETESTSSTKLTMQALGGLEYGRGSFRVAAEVAWDVVPDSLGDGGASEVFGETDLGGLSAVLKLVFVP